MHTSRVDPQLVGDGVAVERSLTPRRRQRAATSRPAHLQLAERSERVASARGETLLQRAVTCAAISDGEGRGRRRARALDAQL